MSLLSSFRDEAWDPHDPGRARQRGWRPWRRGTDRWICGPVPATVAERMGLLIPTHMTPEETEALVELARGKYVLEVGSWLGSSTVAMARVAERVWAVDWHRSDPHLAAAVGGMFDSARPFLDNLDRAGVRDRVVVVIGRSEEVLPRLRAWRQVDSAVLAEDGTFGLAFLDGAHDADQVAVDAQNAIELLAPGTGVLAAHDYGLFGVAEGLKEVGLSRPARQVGSLAVFHL